MTTLSSAVSTPVWTFSGKTKLSAVLAIWFGIIYFLGQTQLLATQPGQSLRPVLLTIAVPLILFLGLYFSSPKFKRLILAQNLHTLTLLQTWRVIGFGFVLLYAHGILPGLFAWPAGLGDLAVGLLAPWVVLTLNRYPEFVYSKSFLGFHLLGILDFVGAAGSASLASGAFPAFHSGAPTSAPMEIWPLILFPGFLVPLFLCLHLAVLLQLAQTSGAWRAEASQRALKPIS